MKFITTNTMKVALIAALISSLAYIRTISFDFTNLDDPGFVFNPAIRQIDTNFLKWAFTTAEMGWWMPLIWVSFAIDYLFWGLNPAGYHLANIILHSVNTCLVVLLADMIYRKVFGAEVARSVPHYLYPGTLLLAGLLFGIQPIHIESVAWVSERKNVLSTMVTLGAIIFYIRYLQFIELSVPLRQRLRIYLLSLGCLALSLMTKPVGVMVPSMLLVADWYPFNRLRRGEMLKVLAEKIPFLVIAVLAAAISIGSATGERVLVPLSLFSLADRFILSGYAVFEYCRLLLFPVGIVVLKLIPMKFPISYTIKALIILVVTLLLLFQVRMRPWMFATWCGFLLPLLPSLYFFINGANSVSTHFVYLPAIVPGIAVAALLLVLQKCLAGSSRIVTRLLIPSLLAVLLLFYLVEQQLYLGSWKNSETLWTRVIERDPVGRAYYYRGEYNMEVGKFAEAADDFQETVRLAETAGHPELYTLYAFWGDALQKCGRNKEAVTALTMAIQTAPLPNFYYYRSLALRQLGLILEADEDLAKSGSDQGPIIWQYLRNRDDLKPRKER